VQVETLGFTEWLKQRRKALDLTQKELAHQVGCSTVLISKIESGQRRPSKQIITRLAQVLAIPKEQLARFSLQARTQEVSGEFRTQSSLPSALNRLIGRESELERMCKLLQEPHVRLVTLTGLGGMGKTRLALAVGQELIDEFPDGIHFISLAAQHDASQVPFSVVQALQLGPTIEQDPELRLPGMLIDKAMLLILDNFEQVLPAATWVADLLTRCPKLRVLVTSLLPLQVRGEQLVSLEHLPLPDANPSFIQAQNEPSIALFVQRVQALQTHFELTPHNLSAVATICRQLEGIPLAIELVAAQCSLLSPQMVLQHLQAAQSHALSVLVNGPRDLPERHRTLRATFDWGHDLLDQTSRQLFANLSVFVDHIPFEAAVAVSGLPSEQAYPHLHTLVQANLVKVVHSDSGLVQFSMLETVRVYASEWLERSQERARVMERFVGYYLLWTTNYSPHLLYTDQVEWHAITYQQHNNLEIALNWCSKHALAQGAQLAINLFWFWYMRGPWAKAEAWTSYFLERVEDPIQRGELTTALAGLAMIQGKYPAVEAWGQDACAIWKQLKLVRPLGYSLLFLGMAFVRQARFTEAQNVLKESIGYFQEVQDEWGLAYGIHWLSHSLVELNLLDKAADLQEQSLVLWRKLNDHWATALALNGLGEIERLRGSIERAAQLYEESLKHAQIVGNTIYSNIVMHNLAHIQLVQGLYHQASQQFATILYSDLQRGNHEILFWHVAGLAMAYAGLKDRIRAAKLFGFIRNWTETSLTVFDLVDRRAFEDSEDELRQHFCQEDWEQLQAEGAALPLDQAIEYALQGQNTFYKPRSMRIRDFLSQQVSGND
jgi:predicted ATPase/DNA-binding XRE family transcriptional regulator